MALISAAVAAVGAWVGGLTLASVGTFLLKTAASMGLSAIAQKLAGKQDGPKFGVKGQLERGADVPQAFIMGRYATAGSLTYANTTGHENLWMTWVITLSDLPCAGLTGLWVNGAKVTPVAGREGWTFVEEYIANDGSHIEDPRIQYRFYDGTQSVADDWLSTEVSSDERPWDVSAIGTGKAYVVVRAAIDPERFRNGFPNFLFEVEGIPLYNPAKDTSVGGAGAHRWADQSTWEVSENPAVQLYNVLRGIRYNGQWFYGLQDVSAAQLPVAHWIGQINKCASAINGVDGPEPLFRSSAEIPVNAEIHAIIENLLTACNGRLSDAGGVYKLYAGAPDAPVATLSDDDILSTSDQSFTPFLGLAETVNGVSAKYPSPAAGWQVETAPPLYNPYFEAEDGGRRLLVDVSLDFVPYAEQAQRLMQAALNEARRARRHTFHLPPKYWPLEPGDVISWTSERNGYIEKLFRVDGVIDLPDADVIVDLTEVDPADYDFNSATDFTPPAVPSVLPQPIPVQLVEDFVVSPASLNDENGTGRRPAILAEWNGDLADVRSIIFELRVKATGEALDPARSDTVSDGQVYISTGILPAVTYEVRAKFIPNSPRPTEWSIWKEVTAPDIRLDGTDLSDATWTAIADDAANVAGLLLDAFETDTYLPAITRIDGDISIVRDDLTLQQIDQVEISDAITDVHQNVLWALSNISENSSLMSDAGIYVDQSDGTVKIAAVEYQENRISETEIRLDAAEANINLRATQTYVDNAISAAVLDPSQVPIIGNLETRISTVEIDLDAAEAAINLKASQTEVDGHDVRLSQAEVDIDALEDTITLKVDQIEFDAVETRVQTAETELSLIDGPSIRTTVADTRYLYDELDVASVNDLATLLTAYENREAISQEVAYAQQDMRARIDDDRVATAEITQQLGAAIDRSVALIETERTVRASQDAALAQDIAQLDVSIGSAESDIAGQATAISGLEAEVSSIDGRVTSSTQDITNLAATLSIAQDDIVGNATALSGLQAEVTVIDGRLTSTAQDLTDLASTVSDAEGNISGNATAIGGLATRVTSAEGSITSQAQDITDLQSDMTAAQGDISATSGAVSNLATRVTDNEGAITSQAQDIVDLRTDLTGAEGGVAANATAVSNLTTRVTNAEGGITSQAQDITDLRSDLTTTEGDVSAAQSAAQDAANLAGSKGKVIVQNSAPTGSNRAPQNLWIDTTGGKNQPNRWNGSAWSPVTDKVATDAAAAASDALAQVATKASASAVSNLTTRVTDAEGTISSQATQISSLATTVGENTTDISQAMSSIDGISAEYTLRINNNGVVTGMVLRSDLDTNGVPATQVGFVADKFAITSPSGTHTAAPFVVYTTAQTVGGVQVQPGVYMENAYIRDLSAVSATLGHFKSAPSGERTEIKDDVIKVFDANGVCRVKLGDLSQ